LDILCQLLLLEDAREDLLEEAEAAEEDHPYHQVAAAEVEEAEEASRSPWTVYTVSVVVFDDSDAVGRDE
jgi:hypothetical protein